MPAVLAIAFDNPAILGAAALAVVPVIIHLLMRSKPRLVVFPALRFVKMTHNANVTRHRLKYLILLLMRMAALALVAVVLARPKVESMGSLGLRSDNPASAIIILDTSGSMAYRVAGQPRLEDAKRLAIEAIKGLPKESEVAVLWPDYPEKEIALDKDTDRLVTQIQGLADRHNAPADVTAPTMRTGQQARMGALLTKAYASLAKAHNPRREIYLFNDCTRDSWANVAPGAFIEPPGMDETRRLHTDQVAVYLFDVGAAGNQDFLLADARWPAHVVSTRQAPVITVTARCGDLTEKRTIRVSAEIDGQPAGGCDLNFTRKLETVTRQISDILPQGETARTGETARKAGTLWCKKCDAMIHVAAGEKIPACRCGGTEFEAGGLRLAKVSLECKDEITEDNDRYLALEVGRLPTVLMIESERVAERGRSIGDLVAAALAPDKAVSEETALVRLARIGAGDFLKPATEAADRERLANAHAVILADVRVLGDDVWTALENYVGSGGTLITLLGPNTEPEKMKSRAALAVLPVADLDKRVTLAVPLPAAFPPFDKNISQVLTVYRENDASPHIDREKVMQYFSVGEKPLPAGVQPLIWLSGTPAAPLLLERQLGSGHSLLLTTTGLGDWSQWSQGFTMPELFYSMTLAYSRRQPRAFQFTMDQLPSPPVIVPAEYRAGAAIVTLPDGRGTVKAEINPTTGSVAVPTRYVGHYRLDLHAPGRPDEALVYAVNFDPEEYTLDRFDPKGLAGSFPKDRFKTVAGSNATDLDRGAAGPKEIGPMIGLALLLLLIGESFFSNRFYRMPAASTGPAPLVGEDSSRSPAAIGMTKSE